MSIEVQKFEAISPKQALGDRTAFIYVRASTKSQAKTLDTQLDQVKASLKALGYKKSLRGRIYPKEHRNKRGARELGVCHAYSRY